MSEMKKFKFSIPLNLKKKLAHLAVDCECTMTDLCLFLIHDVVENPARAETLCSVMKEVRRLRGDEE